MTERWSRAFIAPLVVLAALVAMPMDGYGRVYESGETPKPYIIKGKVTVVFEDDADLSRLHRGFGRVNFGLGSLDPILEQLLITEAAEIFPGSGPRQINSGLPDYTRFYELSFPETTPVSEVIDALLQNPNIRTAEPVWAMPLAITPDDPRFNE
ncbi:MAG: hypothetical protein KAW61_08500 [candidate division Zixibacteria bacterium]|nr:hypothetical protein [candidate division Zixibacteria bacterium]